MRKISLSIALSAAAGLAVAAFAQMPPPGHGARGMMRADANGDGVVTKAEAMAEADARFTKLDRNGDGKLTSEEMPPMRGMKRGKRPPQEGSSAPTPPTPPRNDGKGPGMARADANGDGIVSKAELQQQAAERFARLDANGDGKLDSAELAAGRPPAPPGE